MSDITVQADVMVTEEQTITACDACGREVDDGHVRLPLNPTAHGRVPGRDLYRILKVGGQPDGTIVRPLPPRGLDAHELVLAMESTEMVYDLSEHVEIEADRHVDMCGECFERTFNADPDAADFAPLGDRRDRDHETTDRDDGGWNRTEAVLTVVLAIILSSPAWLLILAAIFSWLP